MFQCLQNVQIKQTSCIMILYRYIVVVILYIQLTSALSPHVGECMDGGVHLRSMERKVSKLEGEAATFSAELAKKSREVEAAREERVKLQRSLERVRTSLEDQREEGTELISKVTTQAAEILRLQGNNSDLQSKLNMAELLSQQVCSISRLLPQCISLSGST